MLAVILAFIAGTIVMDFLWAWKLGLVQATYEFFKWKLSKKEHQS